MCRIATMFLLCAWFCGTHQQDSIIKSKVKEIYGINPFDESTEKPSVSVDDSCECPDKLYASGARNCVCVPYYHCDDRNVVDRLGRGIIDVRAEEDHSCPSLGWCCSLDNVINTPILPDDHKSLGCGWRKPNGVGFHLTGNSDEAEFGEFPWMVAILSYTGEFITGEDSLLSYKCGGTLIHPQAVITGAHCVADRAMKYLTRMGEWDSQSTREPYPSQDRKVKSIIIHPDFSGDVLLNNVAFLLLESPVNITNPNVGVACLPRQGETFSGGTRCFATGWGKDKFGQQGNYQVILKKIDLPIVERNTCQRIFRQTRLGNYFLLHRSFICAGGEPGKDTCKGDGGSPLVCPILGIENRYQLAGIVSWGLGCGDDGIPAAYANVALFRDWIDQQATNNNLDISTYAY